MCYGNNKGSTKKFFDNEEDSKYFKTLRKQLNDEVEHLSDSEVLTCNLQEWSDYYVDKYNIFPIEIFENNIEKSMEKVKIKKYNPLYERYYDDEYYEVDGVSIIYKIQFDGDSKLFELAPSTRYISTFEVQNFKNPYKEEFGSFALKFDYTNNELESKGDSANEYVQNQFDNKFELYKNMISNLNNDVKLFNLDLPKFAISCLEKRKKKAESFANISNALQIPLKVSENAPNTKPIRLKRTTRKPSTKPTAKPQIAEPYISIEDYNNINNIIYMCGTAMEKTARTHVGNLEEELRDLLLATLNTHYVCATGETFRKIGKTDINIEFENKSAYIGECKIWHGEQAFKEAVQQIINYSTWRDIKLSIIIFNKENKNFMSIISKIDKWINSNTKTHTQKNTNFWSCIYHRDDQNVDIELSILAFDLYVDKKQFKDSRYSD